MTQRRGIPHQRTAAYSALAFYYVIIIELLYSSGRAAWQKANGPLCSSQLSVGSVGAHNTDRLIAETIRLHVFHVRKYSKSIALFVCVLDGFYAVSRSLSGRVGLDSCVIRESNLTRL